MAKLRGQRSSFCQLARLLVPILALVALALGGVHVFSGPFDPGLKVLFSVVLGGGAGLAVFLAMRLLWRAGMARDAKPQTDSPP